MNGSSRGASRCQTRPGPAGARERLLRAETLHGGDPLKTPRQVADLAQLLLALLLEDEELAEHQLNYAQRGMMGTSAARVSSSEMPTIFQPVMDTATVVLPVSGRSDHCTGPRDVVARSTDDVAPVPRVEGGCRRRRCENMSRLSRYSMSAPD